MFAFVILKPYKIFPMNKFFSSIPLLLLLTTGAFGQDIAIQVIGAAGGNADQYGYTVGEAVIATIMGNDHILTQGFHQPEKLGVVSTGEPSVTQRPDARLRPNPAADKLLLAFDSPSGDVFSARIFNAVGQSVTTLHQLSDAQETTIECHQLPAGHYQLSLQAADGSWTAILPFVKVD